MLGVIAMQLAGVAMQGKFFPYHYAASLQLIGFLAGLGLYKLWRRCLAGGFGGARQQRTQPPWCHRRC